MGKQKKINLSVFKRLFQYTKPYRGLFFLAVFGTVFLAVLSIFRPLIIQWVLSSFFKTGNAQFFLYCILGLLGMLIAEALMQFLNTFNSNLLAQNIIRDIRIDVFKRISSFRVNYFDKMPIGNLVTRVVSDIEAISEVFSAGFIEILGDLLILVGVLFMMFFVDWQLAAISLIPIPLLLLATRIFAKAMRKSFQQESTAVSQLNSFVQEHIQGMNIVQLFGRQPQEMKAFEEVNAKHRKAHINAIWAFSIFFPVVEILSSFAIALCIVWAAVQVTGKTSDPNIFEKVFAFNLWISMLFRPIRQLADKFNILQRGVVRSERVFEVIDTTDEVQHEGTLTDVDFQQDITLKNVSFAYVEENWVLDNINLTIPKGKLTAFVGATGSGKTTIVNLLSRFYEYQKGEVSIGTTKIEDITLETLRKNIAVVLQDVFLFSDSVHNNITLGNPDITREQVIEASKKIGAHDFISKLPSTYDFEVGERGGVLSVGQRQMLAFIRAYVYNPHVLVLDEATSSVDNESEALIQKATQEITKGRTSIVIAHRLSTIQSADFIVVIDKGSIIEQGTHQELLKQNGQYKRLHDMQFSAH
jgi:ATP-binding cassette, subfamily B, multidrug efflux pump